jgi:hypothetical protein
MLRLPLAAERQLQEQQLPEPAEAELRAWPAGREERQAQQHWELQEAAKEGESLQSNK